MFTSPKRRVLRSRGVSAQVSERRDHREEGHARHREAVTNADRAESGRSGGSVLGGFRGLLADLKLGLTPWTSSRWGNIKETL